VLPDESRRVFLHALHAARFEHPIDPIVELKENSMPAGSV
jgi:hypothetical protein